MLEMLKARKEALQAEGKKGFTLMEMLIVIAIIAVLIAIAIPVFTTQLNNAKASADQANARSIYAIAMADYMDNSRYDNTYPGGSTANANYTITMADGSTQVFAISDVGSISVTAANASTGTTAAPTVSLTTNGNTYDFPGAPTGTSGGTTGGTTGGN